MRRITITALLVVPLTTLTSSRMAEANPSESKGFGCGGYCLRMFAGIHQQGPLFNYGPYYGYYPFKPYGPWDAYLRYDPYFYGDPYRNWNAEPQYSGNMHGLNQKLRHSGPILGGHRLLPGFRNNCNSCGFWHTSWLHGGWFRGHAWLQGGHGSIRSKHAGCSTCGSSASILSNSASADVKSYCTGIGDPAQSAVFYSALPTLNPVLELTGGTK